VVPSRRPSPGRLIGFLALLVAVSWALGAFAAFPVALSAPGEAALVVAFKHVAPFEAAGLALRPEELERLPRHMRPESPEGVGTGRRVDTLLRVALDGRPLLDKRYRPGGLRHDGPTFAYEEVRLPAGRHRLEVTVADAASPGSPQGRRWRLEEEVEVRPRQVLLLDLTEEGLHRR
jgi:hypothetical protein